MAPFSQNSRASGAAGFVQAQLTHWKPSTLFCRVSASVPLSKTPSLLKMLPRDRAEPQPPEGRLYGLNDCFCDMYGFRKTGAMEQPQDRVWVACAPEPLTARDVAGVSAWKINAMVSSAYLVRKPAPPSELKRFFNQQIMPAAIDGAGFLDMGIAKVTREIRRNPNIGLGLALGLALGVLVAISSSFTPRAAELLTGPAPIRG